MLSQAVGRRLRILVLWVLSSGLGCSARSDYIPGDSSGPPAGAGTTAGAGAGGIGGTLGGAGGIGGTPGTAGMGASAQACARGFESLDPGNAHCGTVTCSALPERGDPRYEYAEHCCSSDARCGAGAEHLFGGSCFERDAPGTPSDECPGAVIFIYYDFGSKHGLGEEFLGCCLPDGRCGLDTSDALGAGCVERSRLSDAVRSACTAESFDVLLEPMSCTP